MGRQEEVRENAQDEIDTLAHNNAQVSKIAHHTQEEAENTIGLSWTNLSHVYFQDAENVGTIQELKELLEEKEYLVVIEQENNQLALCIQSTKELFDRFVDD